MTDQFDQESCHTVQSVAEDCQEINFPDPLESFDVIISVNNLDWTSKAGIMDDNSLKEFVSSNFMANQRSCVHQSIFHAAVRSISL